MLNCRIGSLADELGDAAAVAVGGITLVAKNADPAAGSHQRGELVELLVRCRGRQMGLVDAEQVGEPAAARGGAAVARSAEAAQMQIADAALVEPGRELALGDAGTA